MKYALIGCGRIAPNHLRAAKMNGFDTVAVCDCVAEHIDRMFSESVFDADEIGRVRRYSDWNEMLDSESPDLVSIALPSGLHAAAAIDVISRGISCIIEKPMAMSLRDADEIIRITEKTGATVAVCHQNRFNTAVQEMRAALESGRFGKISNGAVTVRWHRDERYYSQDDWRGKWATDGGTLMNQCIHGIDLLRWMCGDEIDSVFGMTNNIIHPYIEAEDIGVAVVKFKNGAVATIEGTVNVNGRNMEEHLTLIGESGTVKLGGTCANTVDFWSFNDDPSDTKDGLHEKVANVYGNGHISLFGDVAEAIRDGRRPYVDVYAGRRALELVLAVYKSSYEGVPVKLPLDNTASVDFADTDWGNHA